VGRKWLTLRQSGERLPESRCVVEDKRPLCQLSSKRSEDSWQSGLLSSTVLAQITITAVVADTTRRCQTLGGTRRSVFLLVQHTMPSILRVSRCFAVQLCSYVLAGGGERDRRQSEGPKAERGRILAFTRYWFTLRLVCTNQPSFHSPRLPALPTLVQHYCTIIGQYTTPLPTSRVYVIHHTILVITISCKGQVVP